MNQPEGERPAKPIFPGIAAAALIIALPSIHREFGWLASMIPLPVFYYLVLYGQKRGGRLIAGATGVAALVAAFLGSFTYYLFSLTMMPVGILLAQSAGRREPAIIAGLKGVALLAGAWILFAMIYSLGNQTNFYAELQEGIDRGFQTTLLFYRDSGQFSGEALKEIEGFLEKFRQLINKMLPALVLSSIICTVWLNMLIGQWLLKKKGLEPLPWKNFSLWRLPDFFVWPVIGAGAALLLPVQALNIFGLNLGLVLGVLYFTQGIAILSFFLKKWTVPPIVKGIIYIMLLMQIYGLVLLAAIGLADVWLMFRKNRKADIG